VTECRWPAARGGSALSACARQLATLTFEQCLRAARTAATWKSGMLSSDNPNLLIQETALTGSRITQHPRTRGCQWLSEQCTATTGSQLHGLADVYNASESQNAARGRHIWMSVPHVGQTQREKARACRQFASRDFRGGAPAVDIQMRVGAPPFRRARD
jgi:hypothetical protein